MKEPREIVTLTPEEKAYFRAMCPLVLTRGGSFRIIDVSRGEEPSESPAIRRDR